ncbi:hypothetical protein [Nesterenkonia sp. NBAIMH1]|uniref:hypothetical protein n=1 Tax=Nesterenkonia sp. NBAIMH1 TaxID=2600320 RepID=UPI0011B41B07|nr:hypothetical protein [Nesterenkonia sp. NBAIMH1]
MPTASAVLSSVGRRLAQDPWTQAAVIGPLSVIPARTYPQWLRRTLIWGPTAGVAAMAAAPGATTWVLHKASAWQGETLDTTELPELTPAARTAYALTAGAATYLGARFCFWFDAAAEKTLRTLRVPAPRAAMGLAAAAGAYAQVSSHSRARAGPT